MKLVLVLVSLGLVAIAGPNTFGADSCQTVHVFVALADNEHQGIVPIPAQLGNGEDAFNNLYWGAAYGLKTYFRRSPRWTLLSVSTNLRPDTVLEQVIFKHVTRPLYVIAHAYKGERIKVAISDFLTSVAGRTTHGFFPAKDSTTTFCGPDLVAYIGHEGLMEFEFPLDSLQGDSMGRPAVVLACMSQQYFRRHFAALKADPVLWTTGFMAPEAYTLEAAIVAWAEGRSRDEIQTAAATAYDRYQHCGVAAARRLLVSGP